MPISKFLGKIVKAQFGFGGGGADTVLGGKFELKFDGTHCNMFMTVAGIGALMRAAKVENFEQLNDQPIEVECDFNTVKSWRILTEVL